MYNIFKKRASYLSGAKDSLKGSKPPQKSGAHRGIGPGDEDDAHGAKKTGDALAHSSGGPHMNAGKDDDLAGGSAAVNSFRAGGGGGAGSKRIGIAPGDETDRGAGNEDTLHRGTKDYATHGGGSDSIGVSGGSTGGKTQGAGSAGTRKGGIGGGVGSFSSSGGRLDDKTLHSYHKALADHYDSIAGNKPPQSHGGLGNGADADGYAGSEDPFNFYGDQIPHGEGALDPQRMSKENTELPVPIGGEDLEDLTGLQESPSYEKTESPDEDSLQELGTNQAHGGGLRNSKEQKPLSGFDQTRKSLGFGNRYKGKKHDTGY